MFDVSRIACSARLAVLVSTQALLFACSGDKWSGNGATVEGLSRGKSSECAEDIAAQIKAHRDISVEPSCLIWDSAAAPDHYVFLFETGFSNARIAVKCQSIVARDTVPSSADDGSATQLNLYGVDSNAEAYFELFVNDRLILTAPLLRDVHYISVSYVQKVRTLYLLYTNQGIRVM